MPQSCGVLRSLSRAQLETAHIVNAKDTGKNLVIFFQLAKVEEFCGLDELCPTIFHAYFIRCLISHCLFFCLLLPCCLVYPVDSRAFSANGGRNLFGNLNRCVQTHACFPWTTMRKWCPFAPKTLRRVIRHTRQIIRQSDDWFI